MTQTAQVRTNDKIIVLFPQPIVEEEQKKSTVPSNKKKGTKSEVFAFKNIEDIKNVIGYFYGRGEWIHYLYITLGLNLVRRVGDMLSLTWENFFDPRTGNFREDILEICEDKTDKFANPRINSACREAIKTYLDKVGYDPATDDYKKPVFFQFTGTAKGRVLSQSGELKAMKRAAEYLGIGYNIGTHSLRKTFGKWSRILHPYDNDSMELLRAIYNHSDTKTTSRYIGLTKEKIDDYYNDMGSFYTDYVVGDKEFKQSAVSPLVSIERNDIREIVKMAYQLGKANANESDPDVHLDAITDILDMIDDLAK